MNKRTTFSFWYLALLLLAIFALQFIGLKHGPTEILYSDFKALVAQEKVALATIGREEITGELLLPADEEIGPNERDRQPAKVLGKRDLKDPQQRYRVPFVTSRPPDDKGLFEQLEKAKINYGQERNSEWPTILFTWLLPLLLIVLLGVLIMRQMGRAGSMVMSFGKSKAKIVVEKDTKTTFDDVAGCEEAKEELREIIEFLKNPKKFQSLGGKIPKGVLLMGPPGTGKTLIARAVAGEAGVPFFSISGSDFVEMFVGVGAARVRDLFTQAKTKAPCIVFIDEIDAVGRQRGAGIGGGHDEREQTLNQLLVEMDGFDTQKGVIILAATNRPDVLDPALLRPGRFDRQVVIDTADVKGRLEILKVHTRGKPLENDVDLAVIAKRTPGFTGADLANAVNEAALLAARKDQKKITMADFEEAIDRVLAGPERKSRVISEKEKEIIAYHECGHAIVAALTPRCDPVHKVSIIPRGHAALGYTLQLPIEDRYIVTREELMARITSTLGGRAAEEIIYGHRSTGAQNDLEKCTEMARRMVCKYGMSDKVGPISLGRAEGLVFLGRDLYDEKNFSEQTAIAVDSEVTRIIQECESQAKKLLLEHRDKLDLLARELQKREVMDGQEVMDVLRGVGTRTTASAADGDGNLLGGRSRPADTPVSTFSMPAPDDTRRT